MAQYELLIRVEAEGLKEAQELAEGLVGFVSLEDGPNEVEPEIEEDEEEVPE